jgi:glycine/serine hydroxymethyltransferase
MRRVAELMDRVLTHADDAAIALAVRDDVRELTSAFPLYPIAQGAAR